MDRLPIKVDLGMYKVCVCVEVCMCVCVFVLVKYLTALCDSRICWPKNRNFRAEVIKDRKTGTILRKMS